VSRDAEGAAQAVQAPWSRTRLRGRPPAGPTVGGVSQLRRPHGGRPAAVRGCGWSETAEVAPVSRQQRPNMALVGCVRWRWSSEWSRSGADRLFRAAGSGSHGCRSPRSFTWPGSGVHERSVPRRSMKSRCAPRSGTSLARWSGPTTRIRCCTCSPARSWGSWGWTVPGCRSRRATAMSWRSRRQPTTASQRSRTRRSSFGKAPATRRIGADSWSRSRTWSSRNAGPSTERSRSTTACGRWRASRCRSATYGSEPQPLPLRQPRVGSRRAGDRTDPGGHGVGLHPRRQPAGRSAADDGRREGGSPASAGLTSPAQGSVTGEVMALLTMTPLDDVVPA
jgi:hypothetical protein